MLDHGTGIVIGETSRRRKCFNYAICYLRWYGKDTEDRHPKIGSCQLAQAVKSWVT